VLLLAGEVREAWSRALTAAGFDVRTTGWLDGVTAARVGRPDLVLVAADLPANAPQILCTAFRSAEDLKDVPIAIAGLAPEVAERAWEQPLRADRYIPASADADAPVREVREALRAGRTPWKRRSVEKVIIGLVVVGSLALVASSWTESLLRLQRRAGVPAASAALLAFGLGAFTAAFVLGFASRKRPLSPSERRTVLGWVGLVLVQAQFLVRPAHAALGLAAASLGLLAWAVWAWQGPRVKPRSRAATRWFHVLAGALVVLAALPWIVLAWLSAGS
jgi:hypothetical protein